ncbi:anti-sigma factor antagonist [Streptomyces aureocirculatus]|uniref:anti-sigma factor antagonist n=1 Tax=Streptomyces aureocirculatus TaxID=67275 RepID=UPI00201D827C|nr:anti-sigma factor antagonist [Streptomyces aureocirculatus]
MYEVGDATVIELRGEIDLVASQQTTPLIDAVTAGPTRTLVLDLSRTTFIDCSGLALLMRARRRLDARDARLGVVCTDRMSLRVMGITGLKATLSPVASVREALTGAEPDP